MSDRIIRQSFQNAETTAFGALNDSAKRNPDAPAVSFFGKRTSYKKLIKDVEDTARALSAAGICADDAVTFMLPNCPQAVSVFYAISRLGAVANMIHTLSSAEEISYYMEQAKSRFIVTLNSFVPVVSKAIEQSGIRASIIYTKIIDKMSPSVRIAYTVKTIKEKKVKPKVYGALYLKDLLRQGKPAVLPTVNFIKNRTSIILYSGGSTGYPKGICLSDYNLNSLSIQVADFAGYRLGPGLKFLSAMPLFHGFGLGVGLHSLLCNGAQCVLVPKFDLDSYVKTLLKEKINMLAIVPSMLESFLRSDAFDGKDLSYLKGIFCGADSTPVVLQERVNSFLKDHNCREKVREGYGLTETVTACILNPVDKVKTGSIGLPLGETKCRIVRPGTFEDLPFGETGELIINGPSVMLKYLNAPEETEKVLKKSNDGNIWLFTGDLCTMDEEGYVYFVQRLKRLIITNGYNVSPSQVERVINDTAGVKNSCVIGLKNRLSGQQVAAFVIPAEGADENKLRADVLKACTERLSAYAVPTKIVFMREFPLTKMGKIDYTKMETDANAKTRRNKNA
ncbi:MAG: acyl--CoA ligase [Clostridia bacterium]|nr:acyl--CoA ligase [Clostridia bacterium]